MKTIASTELSAESLAMLDDAGPDGLLILNAGEAVARLVSVPRKKEKGVGHLIGILRGKVGIKGDIYSTGLKWDAES